LISPGIVGGPWFDIPMSNTTSHPLLQAVRVCAGAFDDVAGIDPMYADGSTREALLVELTRLSARVTALRAQVLAVSDDLATGIASRSAATVLALETLTSHREAVSAQRLGVALRDRWSAVGDAVAAGRIIWEQASVLVRALDDLPGDLDVELRAKAEAHLVAEAAHFEPTALRRLGRHVLEVVAPDLADEQEAAALAAEERRARAATRLSFRPRGDGSTDLYARLPDPVAARLRLPRRLHVTSPCRSRRRPRRAAPDPASR
jgi:hypothetical protein